MRTIGVSDEVDGLAISPDGATRRWRRERGERDPGRAQRARPAPVRPLRLDRAPGRLRPVRPGVRSGRDGNYQVQPEYVDINAENVAAVTFQENNAIGIVDLQVAQRSGPRRPARVQRGRRGPPHRLVARRPAALTDPSRAAPARRRRVDGRQPPPGDRRRGRGHQRRPRHVDLRRPGQPDQGRRRARRRRRRDALRRIQPGPRAAVGGHRHGRLRPPRVHVRRRRAGLRDGRLRHHRHPAPAGGHVPVHAARARGRDRPAVSAGW